MTIQEALSNDVLYIDVRSPKEFDEYHLPNSISLPIFSNEERAEIGTLYKQAGREKAMGRGIEVFSYKMPWYYQEILKLHQREPDKQIVIYCWRGGMRSKAVATTMSMMDLPVWQLDGGIRSYRYLVMEGLESLSDQPWDYIVLEGNTGTRKTEILEQLKAEGYPVLDLEGLAQHRGSVFGNIGLSPVSQKDFEARLFHELDNLRHSDYLIIEAESKRLGRIIIPDFIMEGKEKGVRIHVDTPIDERVKAISETYQLEKHVDQFSDALAVISKRLSPEVNENIEYWLQTKQFGKIIAALLEHYYDPRYEHAFDQYNTPIHMVEFITTSDGVSKIKAIIKELEKEYSWKRQLSSTGIN